MTWSTKNRTCHLQPLGSGILGICPSVDLIALLGCRGYHNMRCRGELRRGPRGTEKSVDQDTSSLIRKAAQHERQCETKLPS